MPAPHPEKLSSAKQPLFAPSDKTLPPDARREMHPVREILEVRLELHPMVADDPPIPVLDSSSVAKASSARNQLLLLLLKPNMS